MVAGASAVVSYAAAVGTGVDVGVVSVQDALDAGYASGVADANAVADGEAVCAADDHELVVPGAAEITVTPDWYVVHEAGLVMVARIVRTLSIRQKFGDSHLSFPFHHTCYKLEFR